MEWLWYEQTDQLDSKDKHKPTGQTDETDWTLLNRVHIHNSTFFVPYEHAHYVRVFVIGKPFQLCAM